LTGATCPSIKQGPDYLPGNGTIIIIYIREAPAQAS